MSHHERRKAGHKAADKPKICEEGAYLCTPRLIPGPGGVAFRHSFDCPIHPGERISVRTYAKGRRAEWPRRGRIA